MNSTPSRSHWIRPHSLASRIYGAMAKAAARLLGSSELVESIYVHRSLAAGETTFAKSDIDLAIITRRAVIDPRDIRELLSLLWRVRNLHFGLRVIGECEVHGPGDAQLWAFTEPYYGSMNRRSAFFVYGKPIEFPAAPIQVADAARRTLSFLPKHLSKAVRTQNARQIRKCVVDAWNAYLNATGVIREPYLSRGECVRYSRFLGDWRFPDKLPWDCAVGFSLYCQITTRLHRQLLPELQQIRSPIIFRAPLPPEYAPRTFVIVPHSNSTLPPEAFGQDSIVFTPEVLHLFLHYVNPFAYWILPPEVVNLGLQPPNVESFERSCIFHSIPFRLRAPGFIESDTRGPIVRVITIGHALRWLRRGELPPPLPPEQIAALRRTRMSAEDYYRSVYPQLYRDLLKIWEGLEDLSSCRDGTELRPGPHVEMEKGNPEQNEFHAGVQVQPRASFAE